MVSWLFAANGIAIVNGCFTKATLDVLGAEGSSSLL
jgi:hypothetical protein